jgi:hypothetical protein
MFGFGRRKKYNGVVDTKLNNEYQIQTRENSNFPGILAYLGLIDNAWNWKLSEDEGALYIATLYYCGILKDGQFEEATALLPRIIAIVRLGLSKGMISSERWGKILVGINKANKDAGVPEIA